MGKITLNLVAELGCRLVLAKLGLPGKPAILTCSAARGGRAGQRTGRGQRAEYGPARPAIRAGAVASQPGIC